MTNRRIAVPSSRRTTFYLVSLMTPGRSARGGNADPFAPPFFRRDTTILDPNEHGQLCGHQKMVDPIALKSFMKLRKLAVQAV